jgi:hypothetical protein
MKRQSRGNSMAARGPGITDIKLLFARSGNLCAFPKCSASLVVHETLVGEVCHIKGMRPGSARYDPRQANSERHAYANLILMCPTHHTVIDDDEETYTVDRLHEIKTAHEAHSAPIPDAEASGIAKLFIQSVANVGQSGGLSAHTVNASTITVQSAPAVSHITLQRQIQAVEKLWSVVCKLRSEFSDIVFIDTILTSHELDAYFRDRVHARIADAISEYADTNRAFRKLDSAGVKEATAERPFVTHRVWSVFFVLQAVYGRAALLLTNSFKEHRLVSWRDDIVFDQILRAIIPAHTVVRAKGQEVGGLRTAIDWLESQFLAEVGMNKSHA